MSLKGERERDIAQLGTQTWDLLVVGGGITGAGIARDAALRGLRVALVDKTDLGAGTSSKSTKLVHGGLRYLEHLELKLVFEGTNERTLLMKRAPHLVRPLAFLMPAFRGSRRSLWMMDTGLWIYEALCRFRAYRLHRTHGAAAVHELEPGLRQEGLTGAIVYYDCHTDDARLTLENALDARALGAQVHNHVRVASLLKEGDRVVGARVQDLDDGAAAEFDVRAKVVVNAAGVWCDEVRAMNGEPPMVKPAKGVHLVVDGRRLPVNHAATLLAPRDGRVMFAIPWGPRTVIGTTDTFFEGSLDQVHATRADAEYLLEAANHYFPAAKLTLDDVLATWAGLRPLLIPERGEVDPSSVSREHQVVERDGLVSIAGGKLTTYRRIAEQAVDAAARQLKVDTRGTTAARPLPGAGELTQAAQVDALCDELSCRVDPARASHLAETYGVRAQALLAREAADPSAASAIDPELPYRMADVDEAVEVELARSLDDVLARRVPLLLKARDQGLAAAPRVAERMARLLDWSPQRVEEELSRYRAEVDDSRRFRAEPALQRTGS